MKKALCYNRKSRGNILELQKNKKELLDYCKKNSFTTTYYEEIGSSVDAERSEFTKLITEIKTGKYQILVCVDLSRLTRDLKTQLELFELLEKYNMEIYSLLDGVINPANSSNEILSVIKGIFNQTAYKQTSKKMALGRVQSARNGKYIQKAPFGYSKDSKSKLHIVEEEALLVERIFYEFVAGYSITEISHRLRKENIKAENGNPISKSSIDWILKNRTYLGESNYNSKLFDENIQVENTHEAIIKLDIFLEAQKIIGKRKKNKTRNHESVAPISKLVVCGNCGKSLHVNFTGPNREYCYIIKCRKYTDGVQCNNQSVNIKYIMPYIYNQIKQRIPIIENKLKELDEGTADNRVEKLQRELRILNKKLSDKTNSKSRLLDLLLAETISSEVYTVKNKELEHEISRLSKQVEDQKNLIDENSVLDNVDFLEKLLNEIKNIQNVEVTEQNRIFKKIFEKIVYTNNDNGDIDLKIYFK